MKIPSPAPEVVEAIESAMAWLRRSIIPNLRIVEVPLPEEKIINHEYPFDRVEVVDSLAPPIWARFYEVEDNTPFLCTRAGVKVWKLADVNAERRTGYDWYGYWPNELLPMYDEWKEKNHIK
jgi:PelA/Pel-15E family pectate lyase